MHTSKHTLYHFVNALIRFLRFHPVALQQHPQRLFSVATHNGNVEKTQVDGLFMNLNLLSFA